MRKIKINNQIITESSPAFIVAEIGLNHNGNIALAKKMVEKAKAVGAQAVKFQVYKTEDFIHPHLAREQFQLLKKYELKYKDIKEIKTFADKLKIIFFASPFDYASVDFLVTLRTPMIKIASSELSNIYFIKYIAKQKIPLFVSTGLHSHEEIKNSISLLEKINPEIVLFYCISEYPLTFKNANLRTLEWFKKNFNYLIGFSDHSQGYLLDQIAITLGAKVIEKHFTLDKNLPGPDHKISLNPHEFKDLVMNLRITETILGKENKKITSGEKKIRPNALKGVYVKYPIQKGEKIRMEKLKFLRPLWKKNFLSQISLINTLSKKQYKINDPL